MTEKLDCNTEEDYQVLIGFGPVLKEFEILKNQFSWTFKHYFSSLAPIL